MHRWVQLTFETTPEVADTLADALSEAGSAAVTLEDAGDQPLFEPAPGTTPLWQSTRVKGLFPAEQETAELAAQLVAGLHVEPAPRWRIEPVEEKDWSRAWMDDFKPMQFGRRLWIVPSWHQPPAPDAVNILLDPGLAFGTGTHATTRLCLEWLDGAKTDGLEVIDYGCGSGILAIAAARLGARSVRGVDNDPQALEATRANARHNGVDDRITVFSPEADPDTPADLLLANILAGPLIELAPRLARLTRAEGHIVLSGILAEQAATVSAAYQPWFDMAPVAELDGWVRLSGRRRADN